MKKALFFVILILVVIGVFYFVYKEEAVAPTVDRPMSETVKPTAEMVENYLRENIVQLSPIKAVLGGTWYVVSVVTDLENNSGTVIYEDGHIQEERDFNYTVDENGTVVSVIIK